MVNQLHGNQWQGKPGGASVPAPSENQVPSDLDLVIGIERSLRSVMNQVETFHRGALAWALRADALERELGEARAEIERLKAAAVAGGKKNGG